MVVRAARTEDAKAITAEHPLPRSGDAPAQLYRNYYLAKTLIYVRAPCADIMTGWVDDRLAGFIFHSADIEKVGRFTKSPRTLAWLVGEALRGRFGFSPRLWLNLIRWGAQHFRQPREYEDGDEQSVPDLSAWVGTVQTVPDFRRLGVATALLSAIEHRLAAGGATEVALWVALDNEGARALYERLGYVASGEFRRVGERCTLMVKHFQ
ncbi:MAG: GNAT family N-acetyltransferase [Armatimonadota bacterium]